MKKILLYICLIAFAVSSCQNEAEEDYTMGVGKASAVKVKINGVESWYSDFQSKAVDDYDGDELHLLLNRMFYVLTDAEGTFIKQDTIEQEELASFESMQFDLSKGTYKLYIMGEGTNMSFSHVIDEVRSVSAVEDMWFRIIRFQPVRHELFYATTDVVVDGSGIDINLDIELKRKVGMFDLSFNLADESKDKIVAINIMIPDGYLANYMNVDGSLGFDTSDISGSGYYWTYTPVQDDSGHYRFFMFPNLSDYEGSNKPKIFLTYSKNGGVEFFNKEIKLDDLKIEENRITSVNVTID